MMDQKIIRIGERIISDPLSIEQRSGTITEDRMPGSAAIRMKEAVIGERDFDQAVHIHGQEFSPALIEKTCILLPDLDLSPRQWDVTPGGAAHYGTINHGVETPDNAKYIQAAQSELTEAIRLSNPPADLVYATALKGRTYFRLRVNISASWIQTNSIVKETGGSTFLSYGGTYPDTLLTPFEDQYTASGLNIPKAVMDNLEVRFISAGSGWAFFAALMQVSEFQVEVTYMGTP